MVTSFDKDVEAILADRNMRKHGTQHHIEYFVKWKGLPSGREMKEVLCQFKARIEHFKNEDATWVSSD